MCSRLRRSLQSACNGNVSSRCSSILGLSKPPTVGYGRWSYSVGRILAAIKMLGIRTISIGEDEGDDGPINME